MMNEKLKSAQIDLFVLRENMQRAEDALNTMKEQEKDLLKEIEVLQDIEKPSATATNLWCRISNAIIAKYKPMAESDPMKAIRQLTTLKDILVISGILTDLDLERAL